MLEVAQDRGPFHVEPLIEREGERLEVVRGGWIGAIDCRIHASDLSIRPIRHQQAELVQAHIPVCFLAYVLWTTLEQWQRQAGLGSRPRTILAEIGRIQSTDVVLPHADEPGRELRIRCIDRPNVVPTREANPATNRESDP